MSLVRCPHQYVIETLTQSVRVLSLDQIAELLGTYREDARRIVASLKDAGLVSTELHLVVRPSTAISPLVAWRPGMQEPDFGPVAYYLRKRAGAVEETELVLPTSAACKQFGGTRVRPRANEWNHDLWMSSVFLHYRTDSDLLDGVVWTSGDTLRSDGEAFRFQGRVPDACLCRWSGEIEKIVEGGGQGYGKSKLSRMHRDYCQYAYEIW